MCQNRDNALSCSDLSLPYATQVTQVTCLELSAAVPTVSILFTVRTSVLAAWNDCLHGPWLLQHGQVREVYRSRMCDQELMRDPVVCADGHSYERSVIEAWLQKHDTSPLTVSAS